MLGSGKIWILVPDWSRFKSSEPNAGHVTRKIGPLYFNKTLELSDLVTHFTKSRGPCNNFKVIECISCKERIEIIGMKARVVLFIITHFDASS